MKSKVRTLIIEDEEASQIVLKRLISESFPEINVIGLTTSIRDSIGFINEHNPELILCDILLTDGEAFQIFDNVTFWDFEVIFITAYHQYATKAFEMSAISYLLKPVVKKELAEAMKKREIRKSFLDSRKRYDIFNDRILGQGKNIVVREKDRDVVVFVDDVLYLMADGNYTKLHCIDGTVYLACKNIGAFLSSFPISQFFKISRSTVINLAVIQEIKRLPKLLIKLKNGKELEGSRQNKKEIINAFHSFHND